jgi:DNA transposition AAA+ family ATPase
MKAKDLMNINVETKRLIAEYMEKKQMSLASFARGAGVHQSQLWIYIHGDMNKGLHGNTIEKIGKFLTENP